LSGSTVVTDPGPKLSKPARRTSKTPFSTCPGYGVPSGLFDAYSSAVEIVIVPGVFTLVVTPTTPFCATRLPSRFTLPRAACTIPVFVSVPAGVTSIATPALAAGSPIPTPDGVVAAIVKQAGSAAALGKVGVVTHLDQASLAVRVSNAAGVQAAVPAAFALPSLYDTSAQMPAMRRRDLYLLSNAGMQLAMLRLDLINREYPNG
jgi:hypothetical protein